MDHIFTIPNDKENLKPDIIKFLENYPNNFYKMNRTKDGFVCSIELGRGESIDSLRNDIIERFDIDVY
jgi:hypothetical protein